MLIVIGRARTTPDRRPELLAAASTVADATVGEVGCRSYGFYADISDENTIVGIEVWQDQAALDAHMEHGHTREFLEKFPDLIIGEPSIAVYSVP